MAKIFVKSRGNLKTLQDITSSISSDLPLETLYKRIVQAVARITGVDACFLYLLGEDGRSLNLKASARPIPAGCRSLQLQLGEGLTGWVAREREPLAITETAYRDPRFKLISALPEDRYESFLSVPMVSKGRLVGVINGQHRQAHEYPKEEVLLVWMVAQQVAGVVEAAKLGDRAKANTARLEALSAISQAVSSGKDLSEILDAIVSVTAKLMNSRICSVLLADERQRQLQVRAKQGLSDHYRLKMQIPMGEGISGKVAQAKEPVSVLDVRTHAEYLSGDVACKEGLCSLLSVPMLVRSRVVGVLNSYTAEPHEFGPEEIQVLQAIAHQGAVAVENAQLQEKASSIEEELQARKWVERAKGILMKQGSLSENEAYHLLRKKSMDIRKPLKEIAQVIVLAARQ